MAKPAVLKGIDTIAELRDQIIEDITSDLDEFLTNAESAVWLSDGKFHTSFSTTVSIKKKLVADEQTISMEINSRERIPKPVVRHDLEFNEGKQLRLL